MAYSQVTQANPEFAVNALAGDFKVISFQIDYARSGTGGGTIPSGAQKQYSFLGSTTFTQDFSNSLIAPIDSSYLSAVPKNQPVGYLVTASNVGGISYTQSTKNVEFKYQFLTNGAAVSSAGTDAAYSITLTDTPATGAWLAFGFKATNYDFCGAKWDATNFGTVTDGLYAAVNTGSTIGTDTQTDCVIIGAHVTSSALTLVIQRSLTATDTN